jgi:hypothetical protein
MLTVVGGMLESAWRHVKGKRSSTMQDSACRRCCCCCCCCLLRTTQREKLRKGRVAAARSLLSQQHTRLPKGVEADV